MRKLFIAGLIILFLIPFLSEAAVRVKGYYRKDGTYVQPHYRSNPDGNPYNNWSFPGNTNPYTDKVAPGNPSTYLENYYKGDSIERSLPSANLTPSYSPSAYTPLSPITTVPKLWYIPQEKTPESRRSSTYSQNYRSDLDRFIYNHPQYMSKNDPEGTLYSKLLKEANKQYGVAYYEELQKAHENLAVAGFTYDVVKQPAAVLTSQHITDFTEIDRLVASLQAQIQALEIQLQALQSLR